MPPVPKKEYRWIGDHHQDFAGGVMVGPGDFVKLTDDEIKEDHNKRLLDEGALILIPDSPPKGESK
jgi:hypothetical protein